MGPNSMLSGVVDKEIKNFIVIILFIKILINSNNEFDIEIPYFELNSVSCFFLDKRYSICYIIRCCLSGTSPRIVYYDSKP